MSIKIKVTARCEGEGCKATKSWNVDDYDSKRFGENVAADDNWYVSEYAEEALCPPCAKKKYEDD